MGWIKNISALVLLLAFGLQCFNKTFIVVDYYSNTEAYAKECINKSRPKMHCNGRCAMMRKLKADEKKDADNPERKSENRNEIFPPFELINNEFTALNISFKKSFPYYNDNRLKAMPRNSFKPPGVIV